MEFPAEQIFESYEKFHETEFPSSKFKHSTIEKLVGRIKQIGKFETQTAGKSFKGKKIYLIKFGGGKKKIFLWSQMHGDEPTATMAIFDLLNFFNRNDEFNELREIVEREATIYFLPMLNPDGAELNIRRNWQGIDINRDAEALVTPEGKLLNDLAEKIKPDFAFNLHDQDKRHSVGETKQPALISLLAPPFDFNNSKSPSRENAIRLVVGLFSTLNLFIPGKIARYSDEHEPRSFGDTIQGKGIATILIESGRNLYDPDKNFSRKLNFIALLKAFLSISTEAFKNEKLTDYEKIPFNGEEYYDLILKNVHPYNNRFVCDIAINRDEISIGGHLFYCAGMVRDIGDLRYNWAPEEIDVLYLKLEQSKIYGKSFDNVSDINEEVIKDALRNEALYIPTKNPGTLPFARLPINLITESKTPAAFPSLDEPANAVFKKEGKAEFFLVNGFVVWSADDLKIVRNGLVF